MTSALYDRDILRLAASIPHHERLARPDASAERRSPVCGSSISVDVVLGHDGRVVELGQEVRACALGQASASLMGAHAIGRSREELEAARDALAAFLRKERDDAGDWPGIAKLERTQAFPGRHDAILLPFQAVVDALRAAALTPQERG